MIKNFILILLLSMSIIVTSCSSLSSMLTSNSPIIFSIDDINAVGQVSEVGISGQASLPDGVKLSVSAIRPSEANTDSDRLSDNSPYSILDRKFATVKGGRWQADLSIKKKDDNTAFEAWQLDAASFGNSFDPSSNVVFVLALEPSNLSETIRENLLEGVINDGNTKLSYTQDGEAYLQVSETVPLQVPSGTPSSKQQTLQAEYLQAWQIRGKYTPTVDMEQKAAAVPYADEDNLSLPTTNMLQ